MAYGRDRVVILVTIPTGTSLSAEVNINGKRIVGIQMSAAWDAAGIAFRALLSESGLPSVPVWGNVVDSAGAAVNLSAAAGVYVALADTLPLLGLGRIQVRSGTNAIPVNQAANRTLALICVDA